MPEPYEADLLKVDLLVAGNIHTSSNKTVRDVWTAVTLYNNCVKRRYSSPSERISLLQRVAQVTTLYITSKPPHSGRGRLMERWEALMDLAQQASRQAEKLKVKLVHGGNLHTIRMTALGEDEEQGKYDILGTEIGGAPIPRNYQRKPIVGDDWDKRNSSFWLEVVDPDHRHGMELSKKFRDWCIDGEAVESKKSFWEHIHTGLKPDSVTYLKIAANGVHFQEGKLVDSSDQLVNKEANHDDWMIFVCDVDWNLYTGWGEPGVFHHSSFLSGKPVRCAGGMKVAAGVIREVNADSGHYRTTPELMKEFVNHFWQIPSKAVITPNMLTNKQYVCGLYRKLGEDPRALVGAASEVQKKTPAKTTAAAAPQKAGSAKPEGNKAAAAT